MRYDRQVALKHIGEEGQRKLGESSVAIVGVGALGSVCAELLARSGVGKLILIDHDVVDESNLQRQLLYSEGDVGEPKVKAAEARLKEVNSEVKVEARRLHIVYDNVDALDADVILDCTDNMQTRFLINDYALKNGIPWVHGAAVEDRGVVYVVKGRPCFRCIFEKAKSLESCETDGILNSASALTASVQAAEALKLLLGEEPARELLHFNVWENDYRKLKVQGKECRACNGDYEYLKPASQDYRIEWCNSKAAMSAKPQKTMKLDMDKLKEEFDVSADAGIVLVLNVDGAQVVVHDYGELLFKDEKNEDRLKELAERVYAVAR